MNVAKGQNWVAVVLGEEVCVEILDVVEGLAKAKIIWSKDPSVRPIGEKWDFHVYENGLVRQIHPALPKSYVEVVGKKGTYRSKLGGVGLGYEFEGVVYRSGGNGFYYAEEIEKFEADGGEGYMMAVRGLARR